MNLFTAAVYGNSFMEGQKQNCKLNPREQQLFASLPNILESYHYVSKGRVIEEMHNNGARVFLDSGAFSAHTLGVEINIEEYCDYIIRNKDIIRVDDGDVMASVLDGIGDAQKTWENQMRMESLGAKPLPCFHFGEDPRYLDWYVERYKYITIGGMVRRSKEDLIPWLDNLWEKHLISGSGHPKLKVHAFGITAYSIMERYPWHSVDSSSWIQYAVYGHIMTPRWGMISVSSKSPNRKTEGKHISTLSHLEQATVMQQIVDAGFHYNRLAEVYESRAAFNLWTFLQFNQMINASKRHAFINAQEGLF